MNTARNKNAALAYALGFVCHFALDSTCHPYVERYTRESGGEPLRDRDGV